MVCMVAAVLMQLELHLGHGAVPYLLTKLPLLLLLYVCMQVRLDGVAAWRK
jgi:hypothetical protein